MDLKPVRYYKHSVMEAEGLEMADCQRMSAVKMMLGKGTTHSITQKVI